MRKAHDELLEVDLSVAIVVKDVDHSPGINRLMDSFKSNSPDKRVLLQLWQRHELLNGE